MATIKAPKNKMATLSQYVETVSILTDDFNLAYGSVWYRGHSQSSYKLLPGFHREVFDELSAVQEFLVELPSLTRDRPLDSWGHYGLMQHHGLPTRLLDWSKSPLTALFFALDFAPELQHDASVWMMDPCHLNAVHHKQDVVFVPRLGFGDANEDDLQTSYLPHPLRPASQSKLIMKRQPIAIEPILDNPRLIAQVGCFTVHGKSSASLEENKKMLTRLVQIVIRGDATKRIRTELEQFGYRPETIYPDLDHLARRIRSERANKK